MHTVDRTFRRNQFWGLSFEIRRFLSLSYSTSRRVKIRSTDQRSKENDVDLVTLDDEGTTFHRNVGSCLPNITTPYSTRRKWKCIIDLFNEEAEEGNDTFYDQLYLWVRPSEDNLHFIKQHAVNAGCCQLVSIGCGSGLLEWLIQTATGLEVTGIEVDRSWWESPYAPHVFLPLIYADEEHGSDITTNKTAALLFCYFNNESAFSEYIRRYEGNCFIVIGPGEGRSTHTHPAPFNVKLETESAWKMEAFQEVQHTKDFIAVYVKSQSLK